MAATNMAAGTWQPGATIALHGVLGDHGDRRPRGPHTTALASGAASAAGGLVLTVTADPAQVLFAVGLGPNGVSRTVQTYAA